MVRRTRFAAALLAMFALLFAQVAVSAFACPLDVANPAAMAATMGGEHCGELATPNLCDRHCDYGAASVNHASPDLAPDVLALPLPWRAASLATPVRYAPVDRDPDTRNHSPPPLALFGALRI